MGKVVLRDVFGYPLEVTKDEVYKWLEVMDAIKKQTSCEEIIFHGPATVIDSVTLVFAKGAFNKRDALEKAKIAQKVLQVFEKTEIKETDREIRVTLKFDY